MKKIIEKRDSYEIGSYYRHLLDLAKSNLLQKQKAAYQEKIVCFIEEELQKILQSKGFISSYNITLSEINSIIKYSFERSDLEHSNCFRHPIPYIILKKGKKYYFLIRNKNHTDKRLSNLIGCFGGHMNEGEDINQALYRELFEETGIGKEDIDIVTFKGVINNDEGIDKDHLGLIFLIEIKQFVNVLDNQEGKLLVIEENQLLGINSRFENWLKILYKERVIY